MFIATKSKSAAAKEAMQVYHMIQHNHSFESMKCTSKMIREVYGEPDFKCSKTKAIAIVSGVFEPMIISQIESESERAHFVSISTDASNHKELKMFPILIRYFLPTEGVKVRLIELKNLTGETGEQIYEILKSCWTEWNIQNKLNAYTADNAPVNFGSVDRSGDKNVFNLMQHEFNNILIGMGCTAHILHNTPHDACLTNIPYDFNQILSLIHKQFNTSTKQTESLKQFCDEMDIEFEKLKSCPNTRFIGKKASINSVLRVIDPLRAYCESNPTKKVPLVVQKIFKDPLHKFYLILVRDLCNLFECTILKIEGNAICGNEAVKIVQDLQNKLQKQIDASYISMDAEQELRTIYPDIGKEDDEEVVAEINPEVDDKIKNIACPLYRKFCSTKH